MAGDVGRGGLKRRSEAAGLNQGGSNGCTGVQAFPVGRIQPPAPNVEEAEGTSGVAIVVANRYAGIKPDAAGIPRTPFGRGSDIFYDYRPPFGDDASTREIVALHVARMEAGRRQKIEPAPVGAGHEDDRHGEQHLHEFDQMLECRRAREHVWSRIGR
jgi:hypothetical protein